MRISKLCLRVNSRLALRLRPKLRPNLRPNNCSILQQVGLSWEASWARFRALRHISIVLLQGLVSENPEIADDGDLFTLCIKISRFSKFERTTSNLFVLMKDVLGILILYRI